MNNFIHREITADYQHGSQQLEYKRLMMRGQKKTEIILYVVLWTILFAAPPVSMLVGDFFFSSASDAAMVSDAVSVSSEAAESMTIDWQAVFNAWGLLAMFCVTFFLHNFFIAPLLVYGNRKWAYAVFTLVLIICFMGYQFLFRPHLPGPEPEPKDRPEQRKERMGERKPALAHELPDDHREHPEKRSGDFDGKSIEGNPVSLNTPFNPPLQPEDGRGERFHEKKPGPPRAFGGQDSVAFIIMALLLGLNIGAKSFFKSLDDKARIKELERENLNSQLEYLKYQINPHFFMNTLNNIHALVDIDPEQAKYTIEVLSKLMRYVLYEGNKSMASLQKELAFISHYVDLMRIRYTDKVRISVSLPSSVPDVQVPSLLFITFIENAFKHGVSYQKSSFIEVGVQVDETIREIAFSCNNSVKPETDEKKQGGVGLQNAKKRLQLIYGDDYHLKIDSTPEEFRLLLRLPIK